MNKQTDNADFETPTEALKARVLAKATTEHPFEMDTPYGYLEDIPALMIDYGIGSEVDLQIAGINLDGLAILTDDLIKVVGATAIDQHNERATQSITGVIFEEAPYMAVTP